MNSPAVLEQIALIGQARDAAGTFSEQLEALRPPQTDLEESFDFLKRAHELLVALERERQKEIDQLRIINDDINCLEDIMKRVRKEHEEKKTEYLVRLSALQLHIVHFNDLIRAIGVPPDHLLDHNVWTHLHLDGNSEFARNLVHPLHPFNLFKASPPRMADPIPEKECVACQRRIHRNSPICPFCKTRASAKSRKKRASPSHSVAL